MRDQKEKNKKPNFCHCWDYFELHAKQRISIFRNYLFIFVVIISALAIIFDKATTIIGYSICIVISLILIGISYLFKKLDFRNRELVRIAEEAIISHEKKNVNDAKQKILTRKKKLPGNCLSTHSQIFDTLYVIGMIVGVLALLLSIFLICLHQANYCFSQSNLCVGEEKQCTESNKDSNKNVLKNKQ